MCALQRQGRGAPKKGREPELHGCWARGPHIQLPAGPCHVLTRADPQAACCHWGGEGLASGETTTDRVQGQSPQERRSASHQTGPGGPEPQLGTGGRVPRLWWRDGPWRRKGRTATLWTWLLGTAMHLQKPELNRKLR